MKVSKFGVYLNYKKEARRTFFYLVAPTLTTITLITTYLVGVRDPLSLSFVFKCICRKYIRSIISVTISASFAIFIRNLYIRFDALNSLLRYVYIHFCLVEQVKLFFGFSVVWTILIICLTFLFHFRHDFVSTWIIFCGVTFKTDENIGKARKYTPFLISCCLCFERSFLAC